LLLLSLVTQLAGCAVPAQLNPALAWREVTGANLESRLAPPGLDQPSGNLGMVPARPDRPDPATRTRLDVALAADRDRSREPLAPRQTALPGFPAAAPGLPALPAAPPARPSLARAAPVPWTALPVIPPGTAAPEPGAVPDLPTPDLLGLPPAPPSADLLAPARPR